MSSFINTIEELVVRESRIKLERLRPDIKSKINEAEVVAYALNRLPVLYATTQTGWVHQRQRACDELYTQISESVHRAISAILIGDPLHDATPLPDSEISLPSRALMKLQKLLNNPNLQWKDVPNRVRTEIERSKSREQINARPTYGYGQSSRRSNSLTMGVIGYLQRSKLRQERLHSQENSKVATQLESSQYLAQNARIDVATIETGCWDACISRAKLGFSNVLENLLISVAAQLLQQLRPEIRAQIPINDVVAYALNRLPPLYATSARGLRYQREYAKSLKREILLVVREAIAKVGRQPNRRLQPLPFDKFNREQEEALSQLKTILNYEDELTWLNLVDVVAEKLNIDDEMGDTTAFIVSD